MGKSKKVKAERINTIRKQYDAFLDEERKRKNRNEYIIEKLDKMRSCSVVLQKGSAHKVYGFTNFYQFNNKYKGELERNLPIFGKTENFFNEVNGRNILSPLNEEVLLQEISKNYILIPRHINALEDKSKYSMKLNSDDNSDWKSKYSILEELKSKEKEDQKEYIVSDSKQTSSYSLNAEIDDVKTKRANGNVQSNIEKSLTLQLNKETDEKICNSMNDNLEELNLDSKIDTVLKTTKTEKQVDEICHDLNELNGIEMSKKENDTFPHIVKTEKAEISSSSSVASTEKEQLKLSGDQKNYSDENGENENDILTEKEKIQAEYEIKFKPQADVITIVEDCNEFPKIDNENKIEKEPLTESMQPKLMQNQVDSNSHETNADYEKSFLDEPPLGAKVIENTDISSHKQQYSEENESFQEIADRKDQVYEANQDIKKQYKSHESSKIEVNPVDQNPIYDQGNTQIENLDITDENQIQEFETEQNNMFYTEEPDMNYAYDQTGESDNVQAEYTNNPNYVQDENYAYYEQTSQEQAYVGEINEHEESNEQYDPHYEEQYGSYEPVTEPTTNIEHYETEEFVGQQSYDQVQLENPESNSLQEVQEQLDAEEGYIEPVDNTNVSNVEPQRRIGEEEAIITYT